MMINVIMIMIGAFIAISYSLAFLSYPIMFERPATIEQSDSSREILQMNDDIAITLPAGENLTISTEIDGSGGIAGVGKPTVVNITSSNNSN